MLQRIGNSVGRATTLTLAILFSFAANPASAQYVPPVGTGEWETLTPEEALWNEAAIPDLLDYLQQTQTKAFVALLDGRIVIEAYFDDFGQDSTWIWYSAGKSLTAVLVGLAQQEGLLAIADTTSKYLGRWTLLSAEQEAAITIRHQLTMTTGLKEDSFFCTLRICQTYRADAGTRWVYHNAPYSLLHTLVETTSGEDLTDFTVSRLRPQIGFEGEWVESGYNNFFYSTPRSAARFGLLSMRDFVWDGTPVLTDTAYVRAMTTPSQDLNPSYGYLWWLNGQTSHILPEAPDSFPGSLSPNAPPDAFLAAGRQGQFVSVARSQKLVWVRMGNSPSLSYVPTDYHDDIWSWLNPVIGHVPTSVERPKLSLSNSITVFPNPASTSISVTGAPGDAIAIYDILGRIVTSVEQRDGSTTHLDVSGWAPGPYVVVAFGDRGTTSRVLLVQR